MNLFLNTKSYRIFSLFLSSLLWSKHRFFVCVPNPVTIMLHGDCLFVCLFGHHQHDYKHSLTDALLQYFLTLSSAVASIRLAFVTASSASSFFPCCVSTAVLLTPRLSASGWHVMVALVVFLPLPFLY